MNDFIKYIPTYENQFFNWGDAFDCTTYAFLNVNEMKQGKQIGKKTMSVDGLKFLSDNGYLDENGKVNYSDQFTAIMSGNTKDGNTFNNVIISALRYGLIPDSMFKDSPKTWDEYYDSNKITPAMMAMGEEWKKHFQPSVKNRNATLADLADDILWATVPWCPGYSTANIVQPCSLQPSHAVVIIDQQADCRREYDSYPPYVKKLALDYPIYAKWSLNIKEININQTTMGNASLVSNGAEMGFYLPATNQEALKAMAMNYGIDIPLESDSSVKWSELEKQIKFILVEKAKITP